MKSLLTFIYLFFLTFLSFAQSPDGFNYQAVIRDSGGELKMNQSVSIDFEILDASDVAVYSESHTATTNDYGLVNLLIGQGTSSDDFSAIDWGNGIFSVKITIDGTDMGTSQLWSVPYAISASNGITTLQSDAITANTSKVGYTEVLVSANTDVAANTAKTGISTVQADAITANTAKSGITTVQSDAITANTAKSGISTVQADAITANTTKVAGATATEIGYLSGVTSAIQTQLDAKGTASNVTGLSDALIETNSMYIGNDPSSTTDGAQYNVAVGTTALNAITTGDYNTAVGIGALTTNTEGVGNTASGSYALSVNTDGNYNTASGYAALFANIEGYSNTALGSYAGDKITTGSNNVIIGRSADPSGVDAQNQIVIGKDATGLGDNYAVIGNADVTRLYAAQDAGATLYAAGLNLGGTAIAASATELNYVDGVTSAIQTQLDAKSTASNVTGLSDALIETTSMYIGNDPSSTTDNALDNVAIGTNALAAITTGDNNVAVGRFALYNNTEGYSNTASGRSALASNTMRL